ncbi:MAG TPA: preprotein translocase subunit YajC [Streptosporangiaceae bacterium]
MGTHVLAAATAAKSSGSSATSLIFIVVIFGALMLFMFRSQRRRQQQSRNTQSAVVNGSRVRTTFGVFGTVIDGDDKNVLVEIAPGVEVKMLRQAIMTVVDDEPDGFVHSPEDEDDYPQDEYEDDQDAAADDAAGDDAASDDTAADGAENGDGTSAKRSDLTI